jgi:hypothetical protein
MEDRPMNRTDAIRRLIAVTWIAVGLAAMLAWTVIGPDGGAGIITWAVVLVVSLAGVAQFGPQPVRWWGGRVAAVVVGGVLVGAVADRFGLLGGPGQPGVSWGDWSHFRAEAAQLVPWPSLVQPAAVAATAAELGLGLMLVAGAWQRGIGRGAAGLFFVYLIAMVPGTGAASILEYGVPILIGGSLLASAGGRRTRPSRHDVRRSRHQTKTARHFQPG